MRRQISLLLALVFLLFAVPAMAATGDATIVRNGIDGFDESIRAFVYCGGKVYVLTYQTDGLYVYDDALSKKEFTKESMEPVQEDFSVELRSILTDGEKVYLLRSEDKWDDESSQLGQVALYTLVETDDGMLDLVDPIVLDTQSMAQTDGDYEYVRELYNPFMQDGKVIYYTYNDEGSTSVAVLDLADSSIKEYEAENMITFCNYKEGYVLIESYDYSSESDDRVVQFEALNIETGDTESVMEMAIEDYSMPRSLLYSRENDTLYYVLNGELYIMKDLEPANAQAVASVQVENWSDSMPALTEDGFFIASDYYTVIKRNTDPSARAQTRLTVNNSYNQAVTSAIFTFGKQHPDLEIVEVSQVEDVVQAMMNRSSSVDVYCLSVNSSEYSAMLARGFLAEFSQSEALTTFGNSVYESVRKVIMQDGEMVALPIEMYMDAKSYNAKAFTKLGLTEEDVPTTWLEYFDFLSRLPEYLEDHPEVTVFEPYYTIDSARQSLFYAVLQDYMLYISTNEDAEMSFDTPMLLEILDALSEADFEALNLPEEENDDYAYNSENILFMDYANISAYPYEEDMVPLLLKLSEDTDPMIRVQMTVAVVNPFSEHKDLAVSFVESVLENMDEMTKIHLCPDENTPIRNKYYESNMEYYEDSVAGAQKQYDEATDDEKDAYLEILNQAKADYEEYETKYSWDATEESIAQYRGYAQYLTVSEYFAMSDGDSDELYNQIQQYLQGTTDAQTLLKNIDKKLRMMLLEGM